MRLTPIRIVPLPDRSGAEGAVPAAGPPLAPWRLLALSVLDRVHQRADTPPCWSSSVIDADDETTEEA